MATVKDIQEYRDERRKKEKKRLFIKIAIALVAVALVAAFLVFYEPIFGESLLESLGLVEPPKGYPVNISGGTPKSISAVGKSVALVTDTEVMLYDEYGNLAAQEVHNCTNPYIRTNNKRAIIYDVGYYSYLLINGNTTTGKEHDNQIIAAEVASNGNYAIASASSKYLTELTVKNKNDTQLASWKSVGNYINALAFSEDGNYIAAAALYSEGGLAKTALRILDLKNEEQPVVADVELSGSASIAIEYLDNGNIFILCDDRAVITDEKGTVLLDYEYTGSLYYYNLNQYGAFVICEKDGEYRATMLYDAKNIGATKTVSKEFKAEEHSKTDVYILENDSLERYDRSFNEMSKQEGLTDAVGITCTQDKTFLLTFSQIRQAE